MRRSSPALAMAIVFIAGCLWAGLPASSRTQTGSPGGVVLRGTVTSSDEKPLEGVPVSAKALGSTVTTSVFTDRNGDYHFPPLPEGRYRIWAQAVGFELTRSEKVITAAATTQHHITLPAYQEAWRQLSGVEWLESLPGDTAADRKMKKILHYNCGTCHNPGFAIQKRFARADWELIIDRMSRIAGTTDPPDNQIPGGGTFAELMLDDEGNPMGSQRRILEFYKKDIVDYLTRVRGPEPYPLTLKLLPRPTGEAADIVVTEYETPEGGTMGRLDPQTGHIRLYTLNPDGSTSATDEPEYYDYEYRNGSDWSRGLRVRYQEHEQHDLQVGKDGYVYLPTGIGVDLSPEGNVWFGGMSNRAVRFDVKTEKFTHFPLPAGSRFRNGIGVDSKGNAWGSTDDGTYRLNPETGEYRLFRSVSPLGRPYGLTVDPQDGVWFAQVAIDKVGYVDGRTGEVGEVAFAPIDDEELSLADLDPSLGPGWTMIKPLYQKGPRRLRADPRGNAVWVAHFHAGVIARVDTQTKEIAEYKLPGAFVYAHPYDFEVDKYGMVWFGMSNADYFGKFDPSTEEFTFYPLPTRDHNARHIGLDDAPDVTEVWVPYSGAGKVARVQFRASAVR